MARRRRTRYTWLPNTGTSGAAPDVEDTFNGRDFGVIIAPANGTTQIVIIDLLDDDAAEETQIGPIGVILGGEYVLKRIVGKIFISANQIAGDNSRNLLVGAGIFVARAEDLDSSAGTPLPIGALTNAQAVDNYSPLRQETIREPWIWRRTWILGNLDTTEASTKDIYPTSTAAYGSVADGPHIDAKTSRRVGNDDRLWMAIALRNYPPNAVANGVGSVSAYVNYRCLGAARRAHNRSAF